LIDFLVSLFDGNLSDCCEIVGIEKHPSTKEPKQYYLQHPLMMPFSNYLSFDLSHLEGGVPFLY